MFHSSPLATPMKFDVAASGEQVILTVGNVAIPMHFEHALDFHYWIREDAALAKRLTGRKRTIRSHGVLHDADAKPEEPLPYTSGVAIHIKAKEKTWHREDVSLEGRTVVMKIGPHALRLNFENALTLSQWLRIRAKECQRTAGDTRHWSEVSTGKIM